jgi:hypothetical protein
MTVAFLGLEREQMPHASIVTRIAQQVGGSAGVALLAVVLATSASGPAAFQHAFWWTVGFTGVAILVSFALPGPAPAPGISAPGVSAPAGERISA